VVHYFNLSGRPHNPANGGEIKVMEPTWQISRLWRLKGAGSVRREREE